MYKACLFDLDGTLADTVESIAYIANQVLEEYGLTPQPIDAYNYFAGDGADELMKRCLVAAGDKECKFYEGGRARYRELFAVDPLYKVTPFEGIVETLEEMKARGLKLAVCSNKPYLAAEGAIKGLFGEGIFDIVLGQKDSIKRKPSPEGALMIAKELGVKASECLYIGDTNTDMQTGKSAGMYTIGVLWGFRDREELEANHADAIVSHPTELINFITST